MSNFTFRWLLLALGLLAGPVVAQPTWQWATPLNTTAPYSWPTFTEAEADAAGNTVVAGYFQGTVRVGNFTLTSAGGADVLVARISPTGQWLQAVQGGGAADDYAYDLALDAAGNATVAGVFEVSSSSQPGFTTTFGTTTLTATGSKDSFVATLSTGGTWTRVLRVGNTASCIVAAVRYEANGTLLVAGGFEGPSLTLGSTTLGSRARETPFVAQLTLGGQWQQAAAPAVTYLSNNANFGISEIARDPAGALVVAGVFRGTVQLDFYTLTNQSSSSTGDLFVGRLDNYGQWQQMAQGGGSSDDYPTAFVLTPAGEVLIGGALSGTSTARFGAFTAPLSGNNDAFVARLSPGGQWTQLLVGGGAGADDVTSLVLDAAGQVFAVGSFSVAPSGSATGITFGTTTLTSVGPSDNFVTRITPAGWGPMLQFGSASYDYLTAACALPTGGVAVVGAYYAGPIAFGSISLNDPNGNTYVAHLAGLGLATAAPTPAARFALAPNPATGTVRLTWPEASNSARPVKLLDALGREVRRQVLPARATAATLDVAGLTPGLYVVRCGAAATRLQVE